MAGTDLVQASKLVSHHPAQVLGLGHKKGVLEVGYDADFVVLDNNLNVLQTWINGNCFFKRK